MSQERLVTVALLDMTLGGEVADRQFFADTPGGGIVEREFLENDWECDFVIEFGHEEPFPLSIPG